jgi:hypothetical protein
MTIKVAFQFYGLTRSLQYNYESIKVNFFDVLDNHNINYDVYLHTYDLNKIENTITLKNEINDNIDAKEWEILKPISYKIDNQEEFDKTIRIKDYSKKRKPFPGKSENIFMNLLRQLNSLKEVSKLWINSGIKYDAIISLRPDLRYLDKLDINTIYNSMKYKHILHTPIWQRYYGLNDRFAVGNPHSISIYSSRIDYCKNFFNNINGNSELLLLHYCYMKKLKNRDLLIRALRIRPGNIIYGFDMKFFGLKD